MVDVLEMGVQSVEIAAIPPAPPLLHSDSSRQCQLRHETCNYSPQEPMDDCDSEVEMLGDQPRGHWMPLLQQSGLRHQESLNSTPISFDSKESQCSHDTASEGDARDQPVAEQSHQGCLSGSNSSLHTAAAKPKLSFIAMITMAIRASPNGMATLSQIYDFIRAEFPYFETDTSNWQNSIRHNLSLNACFTREARTSDDPGKGNYWTIDPGYSGMFSNGYHERRKKRVKKTPKRPRTSRKMPVAAATILAHSHHSTLPPRSKPLTPPCSPGRPLRMPRDPAEFTRSNRQQPQPVAVPTQYFRFPGGAPTYTASYPTLAGAMTTATSVHCAVAGSSGVVSSPYSVASLLSPNGVSAAAASPPRRLVATSASPLIPSQPATYFSAGPAASSYGTLERMPQTAALASPAPLVIYKLIPAAQMITPPMWSQQPPPPLTQQQQQQQQQQPPPPLTQQQQQQQQQQAGSLPYQPISVTLVAPPMAQAQLSPS